MTSEIGLEGTILPHSEWRHEPLIPFPIWCVFDAEDGPLAQNRPLDEKQPVSVFLTQSTQTGEHSLSMFFHHSIPQEFLEIVYFHEKIEATAHYLNGLDGDAAHRLAETETDVYARQHLDDQTYTIFKKWQSILKMTKRQY